MSDFARRRLIDLLTEILERCDAIDRYAATSEQLSSWVSEYDRSHRFIEISSHCEVLGIRPLSDRLHEYERRIYSINSHLQSSPTVRPLFVETVEKLGSHCRTILRLVDGEVTLSANEGQHSTAKNSDFNSTATADGGKRAARKKRGRPVDTDPVQDRRVWEAWESGRFTRKAEVADEFGGDWTEKKVHAAIDRHRQRLARSAKSDSDK